MNCINCQNETINPKFCSKSCAASHNNRISPKRHKTKLNYCLMCQKLISSHHSKYCNKQCLVEYRNLKRNQNFSDNGIVPHESGYVNPYRVKKYLEDINGHKCSICNIHDWNNQPLLLILDHIDGNSENWLLTNLRLICSNCDSQLPTYKYRNKGNGRHKRRLRYKKGLSY